MKNEKELMTCSDAMFSYHILILCSDSKFPELMESFRIQLTSVTNGKLASQNTEAVIRISSNDDPYGTFEISPSLSRVQERNDSLQLTISRRGGSLGLVRVSYQTFVPSANMRYATPNVDFMSVSDTVDFARGQIHANINITIIGDDVPEADEYFMVNLTTVRLIGASQRFGMYILYTIDILSITWIFCHVHLLYENRAF